MKVGTITFHWASNFGAVLQTYALQKYLKEQGFDTEVINYVPKRIYFIQTLEALKNCDVMFLKKRRTLKRFTKEYIACTSQKFHTNEELHRGKHPYEAVICGSDQIWNPSFTLGGEGKVTLSYFLDFLSDDVRKIGYAVSFGTDTVNDTYKNAVEDAISKFNIVSVREHTGIDIMRKLGRNTSVVCDPTLLLKREAYDSLLFEKNYECSSVFSYILHGQKKENEKTIRAVNLFLHCQQNKKEEEPVDIVEWLYRIKHAEIVVTNSFHGVMLSLIFNTAFIALPVSGFSMNNRITTVLEEVGLGHRFLEEYNEDRVNLLCNESIDWAEVNKRLSAYSEVGKDFLNKALNDE